MWPFDRLRAERSRHRPKAQRISVGLGDPSTGDAAPVFDRPVAVNGRLYVSTTDGTLLCLAGLLSRNAK